MAAGTPAEVGTPGVFVPRGIPTAETDTDIPSPTPHYAQSPPWVFVNTSATAVLSPTLSISTVSDMTPTELGEGVKRGEEQTITRHDTFYFEDGNVEVVCGETVFRVHTTIISFSSPKLRDMLSPATPLNAGGCPRFVFTDFPEDFAVLLKMIYTPGCVLHSLSVDPMN